MPSAIVKPYTLPSWVPTTSILLSGEKANVVGLTLVPLSEIDVYPIKLSLIPSYKKNEPTFYFCKATNNLWSGEYPIFLILLIKLTFPTG